MGAVSAALEPKSRVVDNDEWAIAEAGVPPGATWRSAVDRCPANLEHSPAAAPLDCAWTGASAGGGTLRREEIGPDDAGDRLLVCPDRHNEGVETDLARPLKVALAQIDATVGDL